MGSRFRPVISNMTPHTVANTRYCYKCGTPHPIKDMTEHHPVPGLTLWLCPDHKAERKD